MGAVAFTGPQSPREDNRVSTPTVRGTPCIVPVGAIQMAGGLGEGERCVGASPLTERAKRGAEVGLARWHRTNGADEAGERLILQHIVEGQIVPAS